MKQQSGGKKSEPAYLAHLMKDKRLRKLIEIQGFHSLKKHENICMRLCASIMSQQLSVKVADVILRRFLNLFNGNEPDPGQILSIPTEHLRGIGLSNAKVSYIQGVARFALESGFGQDKLAAMTAEETIEYLTRIKGVGRWTAEMLLMFTLGHEDIFALDDLGLQQAMSTLYKLDQTDKKNFRMQLIDISSGWSPYRTYACLYLWQWKDSKANLPLKKKVKGRKSTA